MERAAEHMQTAAPQQRILSTFICDGCNRQVRETELVIPVGPRKGEIISANMGCKCADIKLAEDALKLRAELKTDKIKQMFDADSLINKSLSKATFQNYEPTSAELAEAKQQLVGYVQEFNQDSPNLLLVGTYGTGKSHLAVSTTKALIEKGFTSLFLSVPKLLTKIKETYNGGKFSENDVLDRIQEVDLLVLDDIGTEYSAGKDSSNSWTHTKLFEVLDSRSGKPTIFTTNLSGGELQGKLNERNMSRLMDGTQVIKMTGSDYRRRDF